MADSRKIRKVRTRRNPITGETEYLGGSYESHRIEEETDDFNDLYINEDSDSNHCGCFSPSAGRCGKCGQTSCNRCFTHCGGTDNQSPLGCGIPLCRECRENLLLPNGISLPLCESCYRKAKSKLFWSGTKSLAAPIVEFEDKSND